LCGTKYLRIELESWRKLLDKFLLMLQVTNRQVTRVVVTRIGAEVREDAVPRVEGAVRPVIILKTKKQTVVLVVAWMATREMTV
jgi:hypothetical protein